MIRSYIIISKATIGVVTVFFFFYYRTVNSKPFFNRKMLENVGTVLLPEGGPAGLIL